MKGILGDANIQGHVHDLVRILENDDWREMWSSLGLTLWNFDQLGLPHNATDAAIWHACQESQLILITANRNQRGPTSLEATIRAHNTPTSLPVFTLADADAVIASREYAERVAIRLIDYLTIIDNVRGTGRLYLP